MAAPLKKVSLTIFQRFFRTETLGGVVLLAFGLGALIIANSPLAEAYNHLWEIPVMVKISHHQLSLTLHGWINDGLMAMFFLLVGLEIKRELLAGELSSLGKRRFQSRAQLAEWSCPPQSIYCSISVESVRTAGEFRWQRTSLLPSAR
jgi:NhaA family Na+:H+ antiporter